MICCWSTDWGVQSFQDGGRSWMSKWRSFPGWSIFGKEGGLREDLERRKLLDGLNDVEVSKGVLGWLDTCHHPDEGQFLTTTAGLRDWIMSLFVSCTWGTFHQMVSKPWRYSLLPCTVTTIKEICVVIDCLLCCLGCLLNGWLDLTHEVSVHSICVNYFSVVSSDTSETDTLVRRYTLFKF